MTAGEVDAREVRSSTAGRRRSPASSPAHASALWRKRWGADPGRATTLT